MRRTDLTSTLKFTSFAIAFLLYAISQNAYSWNQSLARHSENYTGMVTSPPFEICDFRFDVNNEQHDFQVSYTRSYYRKESAAVWRHELNAKE
jgi:hypothetical protein